ncbi:MAG: hypothetical protein ACKOS8_13150 [Gemmataceae bacterium]
MAERKAFLLRLNPEVHAAMERWARDDLRSLNAQVEFALRLALERAGRKIGKTVDGAPGPADSEPAT